MIDTKMTSIDSIPVSMFRAIRRFQQATEIHAKRLGRFGGLTPLQLLILQILAVEGEMTATQLAKWVCLSQATLSGVLDRLESRKLLQRRRDDQDRRKFWLHLEDSGHASLKKAPPLLPEYVIERFAALPDWERYSLLSALLRAADLFGAPDEEETYTGDSESAFQANSKNGMQFLNGERQRNQ